jgi:hypothetical protein
MSFLDMPFFTGPYSISVPGSERPSVNHVAVVVVRGRR